MGLSRDQPALTALPRAQVEWGSDNRTLVFRQLKMPEILEVVQKTRGLSGQWCDMIRFDLANVRQAFSASALPLVVIARQLAARGVATQLVLPGNATLATLFRNTNWAHLIAPDAYPQTQGFGGHHVPATEYRTPGEQQAVVDLVIDLLLEEAHIERPVMGALEWSLNESTDNVLVHAGSDGGIVQVTRYENTAHIVVADTGQGIGASMRAAFPELRDDVSATQQAILPGVTSGAGQGNGLAGIRQIARLSGGELSILSGHCFGRLCYDSNRQETWAPVAGDVRFPGTTVTLKLPLNVHMDLREALRFQNPDWEPFDYIESHYEDEGGALSIRILDERRGTRSRDAGRALRTKLENLLATPSASVTVDFTGVRMVASSCADEFLGKLRVSMGGPEFDRRVRVVGANDAVSAVIGGAVSQRMRTGTPQL